jgi:glycopeptide antibiotics resistance protein
MGEAARSARVARAPESGFASPSRPRIATVAALLVVYFAVVLLTTLTPSPVDKPYSGTITRVLRELHALGVPHWLGYAQIEFTSNVLLFLPLGLLAALVLPPRDWWLVAVLAPAFSSILEAAQAVFLPERYPSAADVIANGVGGAIGAALALLLRRPRLGARDHPAAAHPPTEQRPI